MQKIHIINSLERGGAEIMLLEYLKHSNNKHKVISLSRINNNDLSSEIRNLNIEVVNFDLKDKPLTNTLKFWIYIIQQKGKFFCWLYHSIFISAPILIFRRNVYWLLHHAYPKDSTFTNQLKLIVSLLIPFSYLVPKKIFYCSKTGMINHQKERFSKIKGEYLPNGYDFKKFANKTHNKINKKVIIGMVARWHPVKNHKLLFDALSEMENIQLILVGRDINRSNKILMKELEKYNLLEKTELIDECNNIETIYPRLNICLLTSLYEAFPNVMVESIASGIPFFSVPVGDTKYHLPPKYLFNDHNPESLREKLKEALSTDLQLDMNLYNYFKDQFSINRMVTRIDAL